VKIAAMLRIRAFEETSHLVLATALGTVKKTNLSEYRNIRAGGLIAIQIEEGDRLIGVCLTGGQDNIMLVTREGMSIRFPESQLRDQGRNTIGVKGITLAKGDAVECIQIVQDKATLLVVTENGYGKRTGFDEYRMQSRGGKGIITIKTTERNGLVVGAHAVHEPDAIMLISAGGLMIRMAVNDMRSISRNTQGVRLISLGEGDKLVAVTPVEPEDVDAVAPVQVTESVPPVPPAD
jgi:DNA gyrase subunit A